MTDISVIILVGKEKIHMRRCLEKLAPLEPRDVFVVTSQPDDGTNGVAMATAKCLNWRIGGNEGMGERGIDRRACAELKINEWLDGVDDDSFDAALVKLVEEKSAAGEYRFKKPEEKALALEGARRFYREFSRKLVPLSDGRYVYFAPDARAKLRNPSNAVSWAEYAFHAVSSSGKLLDGKNFRERLYNSTKSAGMSYLEGIVRSEQCMYRLIDACPENDAVIFVGHDAEYGRLEVVTRLDQFGNAEANLGEVTVITMHKRKVNPPPKFRPLTEVVETVAKHQAAGFSPSTTARIIANPNLSRNSEENFPTLHLIYHAWPGLYAKQFNWALDYVEGKRKNEEGRCADGWILRLDADEYLTPETIERLKEFLSSQGGQRSEVEGQRSEVKGQRSEVKQRKVTSTVHLHLSPSPNSTCSPCSPWLNQNIAGLTLELKRRFCGGEIRHATNGIRLLRLWRMGRGKSEERAMDEHIAIDGISDLDELREKGLVVDFPGAFYDDNLNSMDWWREKHRGYAKREAADALAFYRGELHFKPVKEKYYRLPPYLRAFAYFAIRYFLKRGILDGYAGWMWNFWQGLWYRCLVDREIGRMRGK